MVRESLEKLPQATNFNNHTYQALLMAALELFGEYGLKGTTSRMLSQKAGVNIAAIHYYFGNKKGLYQAVLEYIVERFEAQLGQYVEIVESHIAKGGVDGDKAQELLFELTDVIARIYIGSDEAQQWSRIIMREQATSSEFYGILYERVIHRVQNIVGMLLGNIRGISPHSRSIKVHTHILYGQIMGFIVSREAFLRDINIQELSPKIVQEIRAALLFHMKAVVNLFKLEK